MTSRDEYLADSDPPYFFRRVWVGSGVESDAVTVFHHDPDGTYRIDVGVPADMLPPELAASAVVIVDPIPDGLVIYGRKIVSRYEEDRAVEVEYERRGLVFSECFSVACLEGEIGSHPLATLTEITREEYEAARARGWA